MIIEAMKGNWVCLRCADKEDVDFTLAIRDDVEKNRFLTKFHNTKAEQAAWIEQQRLAVDSCFLVIENLAGKPLGTIGFCNFDFVNNICECGHYVSWGMPMENVEANLLMLDYLFNVSKISKSYIYVYPENKQVVSLNQRFGYKFVKEETMGNGDLGLRFELESEQYNVQRKKIVALLDTIKK